MTAMFVAERPSPARLDTVLREIVREAVAAMVERQTAGIRDAERLERVEAELRGIRDALRAADWSHAAAVGSDVARRMGLPEDQLQQPAAARQVLQTARQVRELDLVVERDMDDPLELGRGLMVRNGLEPSVHALRPPMLLSEAIEKACREATKEVERKLRSVGRVSVAVLGDVPVESLSFDDAVRVMRTLWMLPKSWGKSHGRNRFEPVGVQLSPLEEIAAADKTDAETVDAILTDASLSKPERRRQLVLGLIPRLTDQYVVVLRDMLQRIIRAAVGAKRVGRDVDDEDRIVPSHRQMARLFVRWHKEMYTPCGQPTRIARHKKRRSWSHEHIWALLLSPIYAGSSSKTKRWKKATSQKRFTQRDALYWVPLMMLTLGVRPEEVLQLRVSDVQQRDRVLCLSIGDGEDARIKTSTSRRILPVPEVLLRLGFRDWIREKHRAREIWLFPEIEPDACNDRRSEIFRKRLQVPFGHLKLKHAEEDVYALRRTLASRLLAIKVDTSTRQRVLGHLDGTTVDAHYSDHGLAELKATLDEVDYGIVVGRVPGIAFPIITGCTLDLQRELEVQIVLADDGSAPSALAQPETDQYQTQGLSL